MRIKIAPCANCKTRDYFARVYLDFAIITTGYNLRFFILYAYIVYVALKRRDNVAFKWRSSIAFKRRNIVATPYTLYFFDIIIIIFY